MDFDNIKISATAERRFSAHHLLLRTAQEALDRAEFPEFPLRQQGPALTAITLSAFALEALLNLVGSLEVKHWEDFDRLAPRGKLRLVAHALNIPIDFGRQPWQDFKWLMDLRNDIAHAKPRLVTTKRVLSLHEYAAEATTNTYQKPPAPLEIELTLANGRKAVEACKAIVGIFADSVEEEELGVSIRGDAWSRSYGPLGE